MQAKSGGHSYASFSTGGKNGSLIVNLQNFHSIIVDGMSYYHSYHFRIWGNTPKCVWGALLICSDDGIATVGAGVRLGNLALELYSQRGRALPHGVCPGVGIGGHFTHGGYGYQSRAWGLALDSVVGLDVILADGSQLHVSSSQYSDVFFAIRGAADSFGIVTRFYLQTRPAPSSIVTFSASIPDALKNPDTLGVSEHHLSFTC